MAALAFWKWAGVNSISAGAIGACLVVEDVVGFDEERFVIVRAYAVGLAHLTEVHRLVLVAQDGLGDFLDRAREFGERLGDGVEVLHRGERDGDARHSADAGRPYSGG